MTTLNDTPPFSITSEEGREHYYDFQPCSEESISRDELRVVSNGESYGLALPGAEPMMITPFKYQAVIAERWGHRLYFVQSKDTGKWGALRYGIETPPKDIRNLFHSAPGLTELLPMEYDELYEDEICTDCSPTLFWVFRKGDKLGILTDFGHTEAIYDGYDTDWENLSFTLYRDGNPTIKEYHESLNVIPNVSK